MCGIFAVVSRSQEINDKLFENSLKKLKHRGPDETKIFKNKNVSLGFTRL
ncbi:hypothetical protein OAQ98_04350 [Alphaproteobacteria bacterium]|nr:hypothetical protein [Alphaproteobacteria bacterium]